MKFRFSKQHSQEPDESLRNSRPAEGTRGAVCWKVTQDQRLGEILLKKGKITQAHIDTILKEQHAKPDMKFGEIALALDFVTERDIAEVIADQAGLEFVSLKDIEIDEAAARKMSYQDAERCRAVPIREDADGCIVVAVEDPFCFEYRDLVKRAIGQKVKFVVACASEIFFVQQRVYEELSYHHKILELAHEAITVLKREGASAQVGAVPQLVAYIVYQGMAFGATDIHMSSDGEAFRLFYRVKGQMEHYATFDKMLFDHVSAQIKQASGISPGDRLHAADGAMSVSLGARHVHLRVSKIPTVPAQLGESLVMRILDKSKISMKLDSLGFYPKDLKALKAAAAKNFGLILATGPTGSGKTTTLYSTLLERNPFTSSIFTVEDPVEYKIPGIRQVQINNAAGITFASALRAFLRQDPDVILVGEIRDPETAETAINAALTGHLVLSTLHANSVLNAIPRLTELGVKPAALLSALLGIVTQRLVRVLCPYCKEKTNVSEEFQALLQETECSVPDYVYKAHPGGCEYCGGTGYSGMTIIYEFLPLNSEVRRILEENGNAGTSALQRKLSGHYEPLAKIAAKKVIDGITSFDEIKNKTI